MNSLLATVHPYIAQYGYGALFGVLFAESFGLPLPGETFLVAASFLAAQGQLSIWLVGLTAWSAAVFGDNVGYAIGRFGGRKLATRYGSSRITARRSSSLRVFSRCCASSTASSRAAPQWAGNALCSTTRWAGSFGLAHGVRASTILVSRLQYGCRGFIRQNFG